MGMDYHLHCIECDVSSPTVEYSIVGFYQWKSIPNGPDTVMENWTEFLVIHSGHRIQFLDSRNNPTDPKGIRPLYVLMDDKSQNTHVKDEIK